MSARSATAAAAVLTLLAVDVVRQLQLGVADTGMWFFAAATCVGVAAALAIVRTSGRERMGLLVLLWLLVDVAGDLAVDWPTSRLVTTLWMLATGLLPATYAWMVLAYPSGYVRGRSERLLLAVAFPLGLAWMGIPLLFADLRDCAGCSPRVPSLLYTGTTFDSLPEGRVFWSLFIALGVWFVALLVRRLRDAPPGSRVTLLPVALAAVFAVADFVAVRIVWLGGWDGALGALDWIDRLSALILPAAILYGLAEIQRRRGPLGDLMMELASALPGEVGAALARAVGDPTLELALWLPEERAFVDEAGRSVDVTTHAPRRAVTIVGPSSEPLAAILHDERLAGQRPVLEAAGAAGRLALENTRLQAQLRAQLAELRASRTRLVTTADDERRRLERDLHDGAQQRLLALGLALQLLRDGDDYAQLVAQADAELQAALRELRDLARGIHPAVLTEQGIAAAVQGLVDRAPFPVTVEVAEGRYPRQVESAVYFIVSEALTNVTKHAGAHSAAVAVAREDGRLIVDVRDDGCGNADPASGGGLQGLVDRAGAVGGKLTVASEVGVGTTVHAEIPCASS